MRPADYALGIFRSPDPDLCVPGRRILRPREPCIYRCMLLFLDHIHCRRAHFVHDALHESRAVLAIIKFTMICVSLDIYAVK